MNSEKLESPNTIPPSTSAPSADSVSSSDPCQTLPLPLDLPAETVAVLEAEEPNLTNNPTGKPLIEMSDEEIREWHARLTAHLQSPQTLLSHVKGPRAVKEKAEPRVDISKYE